MEGDGTARLLIHVILVGVFAIAIRQLLQLTRRHSRVERDGTHTYRNSPILWGGLYVVAVAMLVMGWHGAQALDESLRDFAMSIVIALGAVALLVAFYIQRYQVVTDALEVRIRTWSDTHISLRDIESAELADAHSASSQIILRLADGGIARISGYVGDADRLVAELHAAAVSPATVGGGSAEAAQRRHDVHRGRRLFWTVLLTILVVTIALTVAGNS